MVKSFREAVVNQKPGKNWIQGAVKKPGQLHRDLGIKQGKKIPLKAEEKAAHGSGKTAERARFALAMRSIR